MKHTKRIEVLTAILDELAHICPLSSEREQYETIKNVEGLLLDYPFTIHSSKRVITADRHTTSAKQQIGLCRNNLIPKGQTLTVVYSYIELALSELVD